MIHAASASSFLRKLHDLLEASGIGSGRGKVGAPYRTPVNLSADGDRPQPLADPDLRIGRVVTYIEENLDASLSLDELADEAELSKYHFSRVFREETGQSPWAFVRRARIDRAKELLERGASPAAAAIDAGFCDQSHLTRAMKEIVGKTPGQIRREARPPRRKNVQ